MTTSLLVINILIMMNVNRANRISIKKDYAIFQNDIFQHSLFLNKSIVTIHELLKPNILENTFLKNKRKLDVLTRAILGHQTINIEIYYKIINRLPSDDPLQLKEQILDLRPKIIALVDMVSDLNRHIRNATSEEMLAQVLSQYQNHLKQTLVLLNNALNVHSQVKSSFFIILKDNNLKVIEGITLNLRLLIIFILLIIIFGLFYFIDQKNNSRLIKEAYEDLEGKVRSRTEDLEAANRKLLKEISEKKQAEEILRIREIELQQTLDATTDGIWSWNFITNKLFFSPKYYKMLGYMFVLKKNHKN